MVKYDHKKIEKKWQKYWDDNKTFEVSVSESKKKFYSLIEFPYPSGEGLHTGHLRSNTAMDIICRKRRMEGFNVLYPIGFDAFGLPAENYAVKVGVKPQVSIAKNIKTFTKQLKESGFSFDWSRSFSTTDPAYYKWTQWIFVKLFENGLAYKKKENINWCTKCKIGLAKEEVVNGACERCGGEVVMKERDQWMLKITKYADRLIEDLDSVDYLERIKAQQINWIGKSTGAEVDFNIKSDFNYVLLHGFTGNPKKNFFPWLKNELEKGGAKVYCPELPNTNNPSEDEQIEYILKNTEFDENTIIFGHSLGAVNAMKIVEKLNTKIAGLVLAGGFVAPEFKDHERNYSDKYNWNFDYEKIKKNSGFVSVLSDTNDDAVPIEQGRILHEKLGGYFWEGESAKSHFCHEEEPIILDNLVESLRVFTTRPDTLFGATFMVVAPEHELIEKYKDKIENYDEVSKYISVAVKKTEIERSDAEKEKTGVELKGIKAINPVNDKEIPLFVADYVMMGYGTGAIMAVPAHDQRDFEFAKKFGLEIVEVIKGGDIKKEAYINIDGGVMINSGEFDGLKADECILKITKWLEEKKLGKAAVNYKLRDWIFSRQRYWGEPIPMISCDKCGWVTVPESELPIELPDIDDFMPTEDGDSPLAKLDDFIKVKCPKCDGDAKRETDVMPNWAGSNWYFLRYTDPKNDKELASSENLKYFTPVDWYNGGMEHTTLHLLYSRFIYKFLYDIGAVPKECGPEPYKKRTAHGMILGEGGAKMSKSKGNVINPDSYIENYGADTVRMYEMFMGPFDQAIAWEDKSVIGVRRFLDKIWRIKEKVSDKADDKNLIRLVHQSIEKVSGDIEKMHFNTAVSQLMILTNEMEKAEFVSGASYRSLILLLSPFAPHLAEELWEITGDKGLSSESWPAADEQLAKEDVLELVVQVNGKVRDKIKTKVGVSEGDAKKIALESEQVVRWLEGKEPKKVIYVKGKLVSIVV
jgi:leucyl-tRNA synthetase